MIRAVLAAALCLTLLAVPSARQGKKVYISVDLEGISGVNGDDQTSAGQPEYGRARKLMAEDANAAIRGAFEGGATDVLVNDSHGSQRNLLPEDLDPRARLISHSFKRHGMMEGLDDTFDAVIFVGYHAKADAPRGLFAHTGSGVVRDLQINGRSVGEGGMNALLAAWYGVPVVAVSGDDVAVAEVKESVPACAVSWSSARSTCARRSSSRWRGAARDSGGRARRRAGREADSAAAAGAVQVQMRYRNFTFPEVVDRVSRDRAGRARHRRLHARHDARGLSPDPRALPIHQPRLSCFAVTRPNGRQVPSFDSTRSHDLQIAVREKPVGGLAALRLGGPPVGDDRVVDLLRLDRPNHAGVVEPRAAVLPFAQRAVIRVALEPRVAPSDSTKVRRRNWRSSVHSHVSVTAAGISSTVPLPCQRPSSRASIGSGVVRVWARNNSIGMSIAAPPCFTVDDRGWAKSTLAPHGAHTDHADAARRRVPRRTVYVAARCGADRGRIRRA